MTNPIILRQHATDVATNWWRRTLQVGTPHTRFHEIFDIDISVDAHLDGLREGGSTAIEIAWIAYEKAVVNRCHDVAADAFVFLAAAFLDNDSGVMIEALNRMTGKPGFAEAIDGIFSWFDSRAAMDLAAEKIVNGDAACRTAALKHWHLHQWRADEKVNASLFSSMAIPDVATLDAMGRTGQPSLAGLALKALHAASPKEPEFFYAARSAILLGNRTAAVTALQECLLRPGAVQVDAVKFLCAALPLSELQQQLLQLEKYTEYEGLLIQAAGWSGDATYIPWLIAKAADANCANLAGEAFRLITGLDLEASQMSQAHGIAGSISGRKYFTPDSDKLGDWWRVNQHRYEHGARLLLGRPISDTWLLQILSVGEQADRELAALHLALLRRGMPHFPTAANAAIQFRQFERFQGNHDESS
ncbi:hypothetical protein [Massilia scottii]|uniref:hypothetical protein n=1 Tax=Massilia scottii TaxID=3057166 RepID=UPI0027967D36|nr:hypothetical protein [Massilia sp. CCM 9029]MDQ1829718.1 hypothetical protein [Massilia sp. CCM 9029]